MTDEPISNLPVASAFNDDDQVAIVQSGATKSATKQVLQAGLVETATESTAGILEVASTAEAEAVTLDNKIITPLKLDEAMAGGNVDQVVVGSATAASVPATGDVNAKRFLIDGEQLRSDFQLLQVKDYTDGETISASGNRTAIVMDAITSEFDSYCVVFNNLTIAESLDMYVYTSSWLVSGYGGMRIRRGTAVDDPSTVSGNLWAIGAAEMAGAKFCGKMYFNNLNTSVALKGGEFSVGNNEFCMTGMTYNTTTNPVTKIAIGIRTGGTGATAFTAGEVYLYGIKTAL